MTDDLKARVEQVIHDPRAWQPPTGNWQPIATQQEEEAEDVEAFIAAARGPDRVADLEAEAALTAERDSHASCERALALADQQLAEARAEIGNLYDPLVEPLTTMLRELDALGSAADAHHTQVVRWRKMLRKALQTFPAVLQDENKP